MRHIGICGFHPRSAPESAVETEGSELWGINNPPPWAMERRIAFTRFFQMHERFSLSVPEEEWVTACPVPLYVANLAEYADAQDPMLYPSGDVFALPHLVPGEEWIASSFSWALALACAEGRTVPAEPVTHITLYGIELQEGSTRERLVEHAGLLYWVGYARGLGIAVDAPAASNVLQYPYPYGAMYYTEGDDARHRVLDFERQARIERRARAWDWYDPGMRQRVNRAARTAWVGIRP